LSKGLFFTLGFLAVMAPVAWWDSLRWKLQPNYFEQSLISYGGLGLVDPARLVERLGDWAEMLHYITASPVLNLLLLIGLPCLLLYDLLWRRGGPATSWLAPISTGSTAGVRAQARLRAALRLHSVQLRPSAMYTRAFFDVVLLAFVILFLLGHWLLSFNIWDRYLLGLVPFLLILLARVIWLASGALAHLLPCPRSAPEGVAPQPGWASLASRLHEAISSVCCHCGWSEAISSRLGDCFVTSFLLRNLGVTRLPKSRRLRKSARQFLPPTDGAMRHGRLAMAQRQSSLRLLVIAVFLVVTLARPALTAAQSGYPSGGDHGAYDGIEAVATYFRDHVPAGSILYHHWLGWHYSFYMFDFPLVFRWYASPAKLADDARQVEDIQRYIVFPNGTTITAVEDALAEAGLELHRVCWTYGRDGSTSFTVYRIEEQK